jgi:hypothetical protein
MIYVHDFVSMATVIKHTLVKDITNSKPVRTYIRAILE